MTHYLLDTNHAGLLLDRSDPLWTRLDSDADAEFFLCQPSICELWYMVFKSARVEENRQRLERLLSELSTWELDAAAAMEFGRIQLELKRKGRPIPLIDVQIAAIARCRNVVLLSSDAHLLQVSSLKLDNWLR